MKYIQVISAVILIVLILVQAKGTGLSSIFGGEGGYYRTKRGFEKFLFYLTITVAVVYSVVSLLRITA